MDCKVIISARALSDLEEIVRFIAADNPPPAAQFLGKRRKAYERFLNWLKGRF